MANETKGQILEAIEYSENIVPGVTAAAGKLKINQENGIGCSPAQPSDENESLPDACTSDVYRSYFGRLTADRDASVSSLDEYLPEITLLDSTCDSTIQLTRNDEICNAFARAKINSSEIIPLQLSKYNRTPNPKVHTPVNANPSVWCLMDEYFPEITLLDVTRDSELSSGGEIFHMELTQGTSPGDKLTQDISVGSVLENSKTSEESNEQNIAISQPSTENALSTHPANVTRDISSSSDMSAQSILSQFSACDSQCNSSSKTVTFEIHGEPVETSSPLDDKDEELLTTNDAEVTSKLPQPNPATAGSSNSTFNVVQPVGVSTSTSLNATTEGQSPQNKTLDLHPSDVNSSTMSDTKEQGSSVSTNTTETSFVIIYNNSEVKSNGSWDVQNTTFDKQSSQISNASLVEVCAQTLSLQNNTFDSKPQIKQSTIVTLSETRSNDSVQIISGKSSPKVCDPSTSPKDNMSAVQPAEPVKHNSTDPNDKMGDMPDVTFEASPLVEMASESGHEESKDHLKAGQLITDGLSDTPGHHSIDTGNNKATTFNLDDTLDLRVHPQVTSTPMTDCKINLCTKQEEIKIFGAQKKLYWDGPGKPVIQVQSDIPSNIICDRKTFIQPAVKPHLMPLKAASQLLKYKAASTLPGRREPSASDLPMTRQRTQAESAKNTSAPNATMTSGISSSYSLRSAKAGFKQPGSGLPRPQLRGIPTGIRIPARSNASISCIGKHRGPMVTNPVAKKHPVPKGESLPMAKRKKMEAPFLSGITAHEAGNENKNPMRPLANQKPLPAESKIEDAAVQASTAETSAASRAKAHKQPAFSHRVLMAKPQGQGCAKCVKLEEQLKMKSEEIRRLKELLNYTKEDTEC